MRPIQTPACGVHAPLAGQGSIRDVSQYLVGKMEGIYGGRPRGGVQVNGRAVGDYRMTGRVVWLWGREQGEGGAGPHLQWASLNDSSRRH